MSWENFSFQSVILGYFTDKGFRLIDHFSQEEFIDEGTATRLINKTTGHIKNMSKASVRVQVFNRLYGPDPFTDDPRYSMLYFLWTVTDRFSSDLRNLKNGVLAGLYLIFDHDYEEIIRASRISDNLNLIVKDFASKLLTIDDLILQLLQISYDTEITFNHYNQLLNKGGNGKLIKSFCTKISEYVIQNWKLDYSESTRCVQKDYPRIIRRECGWALFPE